MKESCRGTGTAVTTDTLQSGAKPQLPGSLAIEPIPEPGAVAQEN